MNHNVFQKIVDKIEPLKTLYLIEFLHDNLNNKKYRKFSDIFHKNVPPKLPDASLFPEAMIPYGVYCDLEDIQITIRMMRNQVTMKNDCEDGENICYIRVTLITGLGRFGIPFRDKYVPFASRYLIHGDTKCYTCYPGMFYVEKDIDKIITRDLENEDDAD